MEIHHHPVQSTNLLQERLQLTPAALNRNTTARGHPVPLIPSLSVPTIGFKFRDKNSSKIIKLQTTALQLTSIVSHNLRSVRNLELFQIKSSPFCQKFYQQHKHLPSKPHTLKIKFSYPMQMTFIKKVSIFLLVL